MNDNIITIKGDLLDLANEGLFDAILHGCNCFHSMGGGVARSIANSHPIASDVDKSNTLYGDINKLGTYSKATVKDKFDNEYDILNCYTQYDMSAGEDVFEYEKFAELLKVINSEYGNKGIGMPWIGCGLAGGDKNRILKIIEENLTNVKAYIVELN